MMLHNLDCLDLLKFLADNSLDAAITDPPYGMSNHTQNDIINALTAWLNDKEYTHKNKGYMGLEWDKFVPSPLIWKELIRVLKPGAYIICAASTRTVDLMGISLRLAGFEIKDSLVELYEVDEAKQEFFNSLTSEQLKLLQRAFGEQFTIEWLYGKGFPKGLLDLGKVDKALQGIGTCLKPAHEPFILAKKPIEKGLTILENCQKWGVGGLNIDLCRIPTAENRELNSTHKTSSLFQKSRLGYQRHTGGGTSNKLGRYPANLVLSHESESIISKFPTSVSAGGTKHQRKSAFMGLTSEYAPSNSGGLNDAGSNARFFYCAKASSKERGDNTHPTVKPLKLMEYLITLISREGAVIIDPFMGSGTTGVACKNLNRDFIGCEINPDYYQIAVNRIHDKITE